MITPAQALMRLEMMRRVVREVVGEWAMPVLFTVCIKSASTKESR